MLVPKKSLGQNFLIDKNLCKKITKSLNIKNKIIIEIGPGTGQLTDEIIKLNPKKLILIEKDNKLFKLLKKKYNKLDYMEILNIDAINLDVNLNENFSIVSNLPYNIATKLIFKTLIKYNNIQEMIFLVQKEVSIKFRYQINMKNNKYCLFLKTISKYEVLFNISNKVFYPNPKVESTLIKITPKKTKIDKKKLWDFSNNLFFNKRKKINKNFIKLKNNIKYKKILDKRPEQLNKDEYIKLFFTY